VDIGRTIHPHPTLSESVGLAAEAFEGVCTDLPPRTAQGLIAAIAAGLRGAPPGSPSEFSGTAAPAGGGARAC